MTTAAKRNRESLPVGDLGIIALQSSKELGSKVNDYIVEWRSERDHRHKALPQLEGYAREDSEAGKARESSTTLSAVKICIF